MSLDIEIFNSGEDDSEEWVVSFADLVTVLLCFFILYYTDPSEKQVLQDIVEIFKTGDKPVEEVINTGASLQLSRKDAQMLSSIETGINDLQKGIEKFGINFSIVRERSELIIRLGTTNLFDPGSYGVSTAGRKVLLDLADKLSPFKNNIRVGIEAHTDSMPVRSNKVYLNNMSLSALRAASAGNVFIESKFDQNSIFVVGHGANKLIVKDRDKNGNFLREKAKKNRRIEIRVMPREV